MAPQPRPGYQLTLGGILDYAVYMEPGERLFYRDEFSVTYRELRRRVEALAAGLAELGVRGANGAWAMGDRVATLDWNTVWHLEAYFAVPMMGAVLHPVNIRLAPVEILYVMNHARDKVLIVNPDFLPLVEKIADKLETVEHIVVLPGPGSEEAPGRMGGKPVHHYEDLVGPHLGSGYEFPEELDEETVAAMGYTSGTTGLPKGVYHTHRQIVLHVLSAGLFLSAMVPRDVAINYTSVMMHIVPMFHVYSWGLPFLATLLGLRQVYPGRFNADRYLELIEKHRVTHTAGVPTILYLLLTAPSLREHAEALRGLVFINGGAALPKGLAEKAWSLGIKIIDGYGMTETAPVLALSTVKKELLDAPEEEKRELLGLRTGVPIPLVRMMIADENLEPVPMDGRTMGEIVVRAPWVAREYYRDPGKTEKAWRGGWFHTGDIAVWDGSGYIQIMDRAKDVVKSGGEWISTLRLESLLSQHPCVAEAAVVGARHPKWGERPVAIVVPKPGCESELTPQQLHQHLRGFVDQGVIPKWWLPDKYIIEKEPLPKTSVGKIDKKRLRDKYRNTLLESHD